MKTSIQTSSTLAIEEKLLARGNRIELLKLLSEIEALDRDILVMKLIQGYSHEEIAIHLGLFKYSVETRIVSTLKKWDVT